MIYMHRKERIMTKKKIESIEEFDALSKDEQNEILDEIKNTLGDAVIPLKIYVPTEIKKWWDDLRTKDKGGLLSYEMLLSQYFIAMLNVAINEGQQAFQKKTSISLMVLLKELRFDGNKVYMGDAVDGCESSCTNCTCDDDKGGGNHGGNNTYH